MLLFEKDDNQFNGHCTSLVRSHTVFCVLHTLLISRLKTFETCLLHAVFFVFWISLTRRDFVLHCIVSQYASQAKHKPFEWFVPYEGGLQEHLLLFLGSMPSCTRCDLLAKGNQSRNLQYNLVQNPFLCTKCFLTPPVYLCLLTTST